MNSTNRYLTRREIYRELGISDAELEIYEEYLELPVQDSYHVSVARTIARVHELVSKGVSLQDLKHLSFCAEQYENLVPGLSAFADLSPKKHLKNLSEQYLRIIEEFQVREKEYRKAMEQLENTITSLNMQLEDSFILNKKIEHLSYEREKYIQELAHRDEEMKELEAKLEQQNIELNELKYENSKKGNIVEKLEAQLERFDNYHAAKPVPGNAVDIESLLRKQERDLEIKHQREIFDLKKQVETIVDRREQAWQAEQS